jgi:hypothetical protein
MAVLPLHIGTEGRGKDLAAMTPTFPVQQLSKVINPMTKVEIRQVKGSHEKQNDHKGLFGTRMI